MSEKNEFYSTTLLNSTGDITLTWENGEDAQIKSMIQSKLDAGYVFFIVEPRVGFLKILGNKKTTIHDVSEIKGRKVIMKTDSNAENIKALLGNSVKIGDADSEKLFLNGHIGIANIGETSYNTVRKANSVMEVMKNHTVATPRISAG